MIRPEPRRPLPIEPLDALGWAPRGFSLKGAFVSLLIIVALLGLFTIGGK